MPVVVGGFLGNAEGFLQNLLGLRKMLKFAILESKAEGKSLSCRTPPGRRAILYLGLSHPANWCFPFVRVAICV